jgi:YggT family protein
MFVLGHFLNATANMLHMVCGFFIFTIFIRAILSWVSPDPFNPIVQILNRITEPILTFVRRVLPFPSMGIDFSPMIAIFALYFIQSWLVQVLLEMARRML